MTVTTRDVPAEFLRWLEQRRAASGWTDLEMREYMLKTTAKQTADLRSLADSLAIRDTDIPGLAASLLAALIGTSGIPAPVWDAALAVTRAEHSPPHPED